MTDLTTFVTLAEGQLRFLALSWPEEGRTAPVPEAVCVPVMKRQEGLLLCIPCGFLSLATLDEGENADAHSLVGPSHQCTVPFAVSDEQGVEQPLEMEGSVLLVDFGAQVLPQLRDLGEDIISDTLFPFDLHQLEAVPMSEELLAIARRWAAVTQADRAAFYSAVEDQVAADVGPGGKAKAKRAAPKKKVTAADLAQQMSFLTAMLSQLAEQLTAVKEKQEDLEKKVQPGLPEPVPSPAKPAHQMPFMPPRGPGLPVAKQASLVGPPPRTRNQDAPPALAAPLPLAVEPGAAGVGAIPQDSFQAEPGPYSFGWAPDVTAGRRIGRPVRLELYRLCGFKGGCSSGEVAGSSCKSERRLLPCSAAGSSQEIDTVFPSPGILRRLLGAGVDVPVLRTFRRFCGATGDRLHHVVPGSRHGLHHVGGLCRGPGVLGRDGCCARPVGFGRRPVGLRLAVDSVGRAPGAAIPWAGGRGQSADSRVLSSVPGRLDHLCSSISQGGRLDHDPQAGVFGFTSSAGRATRRGHRRPGWQQAEKAPSLPKERPPRRIEVRCSRPPPGLLPSASTCGFESVVGFASWVSGLLRAVLRTRTPFSAFLLSTLHLPRLSRPAPPSGVIFPVPFLLLVFSPASLWIAAHEFGDASCISVSFTSFVWL